MILHDNIWTSKLTIISDKTIDCKDLLNSFKNEESRYSKYLNNYRITIDLSSRLAEYIYKEFVSFYYIDKFCRYKDDVYDVTGLMKGYAISVIRDYLLSNGSDKFLINFGGDIAAYNSGITEFYLDGTNTRISAEGTYSLFTSSNLGKRGHHIKGDDTTCVVYDDSIYNLIRCDMVATQAVGGEVFVLNYFRIYDYINDVLVRR